jgi:protein ATS1
VYVTGRGDFGQLGNSGSAHSNRFTEALGDVLSIASGTEHILAQTTSNEVWGWGWNEHGNLGLGTMANTNSPSLLATNASTLACGAAVSFIRVNPQPTSN